MSHIDALSADDVHLLKEFGSRLGVSWWLQPKGVETSHPLLAGDTDTLAYLLPEFGLRMPYRPTDFTQVNHPVTRLLYATSFLLFFAGAPDRAPVILVWNSIFL